MTVCLQISMPRFARRGMGTQIHSIKHVVDVEGALSGAVKSVTTIATNVISRTTPFNPIEIEVGETVNAVFLSIFMIGAGGQGLDGALNWYIAKLRGGQTSGNFPTPGETGVSDVRNQIFHEEKGLAGSADGTPMAFKGVVVIPRGMRRFREGDQLHVVLQNSDAVNDANFCIKAIYKSFS